MRHSIRLYRADSAYPELAAHPVLPIPNLLPIPCGIRQRRKADGMDSRIAAGFRIFAGRRRVEPDEAAY